MLGSRNRIKLSEQQISSCQNAWELLCGSVSRTLDISEASTFGSQARFNEAKNIVYLGADAYPGSHSFSANARMSMMACLAHELAHWHRFELGFDRPFNMPDSLLDEAETSIHASFTPAISSRDRADLIEDASDRLIDWIKMKREEGKEEDNESGA